MAKKKDTPAPRPVLCTILVHSEEELRELQRAGFQRVDTLTKLAEKSSKEHVPTASQAAMQELGVWVGRDGAPGLTDRIADQMGVFEVPFEPDPEPAPSQMDWTAEDRAAQERAWAEAAAEATAANPEEEIEADYEIVDEPMRQLGSGLRALPSGVDC